MLENALLRSDNKPLHRCHRLSLFGRLRFIELSLWAEYHT